jgi:hypothetical protein
MYNIHAHVPIHTHEGFPHPSMEAHEGFPHPSLETHEGFPHPNLGSHDQTGPPISSACTQAHKHTHLLVTLFFKQATYICFRCDDLCAIACYTLLHHSHFLFWLCAHSNSIEAAAQARTFSSAIPSSSFFKASNPKSLSTRSEEVHLLPPKLKTCVLGSFL